MVSMSFVDLYSFICVELLYSASSRKLLRGAPSSSTANRSSHKMRKQNVDHKVLGKREVQMGVHSMKRGPPRRLCCWNSTSGLVRIWKVIKVLLYHLQQELILFLLNC